MMRLALLVSLLACAALACGPAATRPAAMPATAPAAGPAAAPAAVPAPAPVVVAPGAGLDGAKALLFGPKTDVAAIEKVLAPLLGRPKTPAEAWLYLGLAHARAGHARKALTDLEKAAEARPDWSAPVVAAVDFLRRSGELKEARALGEKAVKKQPEDPLLRAALAAVHRDAREYDAALKHLQVALTVDPRSAPALCGVGLVFIAKGDPAGALTVLDRALEMQKKSADLHAARGLALRARGEVAAAAAAYTAALKLDPQHLGAHLALGEIFVENLDYAGAEAHYRVAHAIYPRDLDALLGVARARFGLKDMKAAAQLYREVLEREPENAHALYQLARIHGEHFERPGEGLEYLNKYLATGNKLVPAEKVAVLKRNLEALAERERRGQPKGPPGKTPPGKAAPAPGKAAPAPGKAAPAPAPAPAPGKAAAPPAGAPPASTTPTKGGTP
jgi:tetratricopeptide (TPR) repeat protein